MALPLLYSCVMHAISAYANAVTREPDPIMESDVTGAPGVAEAQASMERFWTSIRSRSGVRPPTVPGGPAPFGSERQKGRGRGP